MSIGSLQSILGEPFSGAGNWRETDDECATRYHLASEVSRMESDCGLSNQSSQSSYNERCHDGHYTILRACSFGWHWRRVQRTSYYGTCTLRYTSVSTSTKLSPQRAPLYLCT